ncbi:hypothetical protein D3C75_916130 [compost metagenome]
MLKHPFFSDVLQTTCFDHWTVRRVCSEPLDVQTFHDAFAVEYLIRSRWHGSGPVAHLNPVAAIGGHVAIRFEGRAIICVHVVDTVNTQDRVLDAACGGWHVPTIQIDLAVDVTHVVDVLVGEFRTFQEEPRARFDFQLERVGCMIDRSVFHVCGGQGQIVVGIELR